MTLPSKVIVKWLSIYDLLKYHVRHTYVIPIEVITKHINVKVQNVRKYKRQMLLQSITFVYGLFFLSVNFLRVLIGVPWEE